MSQRKQRREASTKKSTGRGADSRALSENETALAGALQWLLADVEKDAIAWRKECRWTTPTLIAVAILWVWLDAPTLTARYERSWKIGRRLFRTIATVSYPAFIKLLGQHTQAALELMKPLLRGRMERSLASQFLLAGFALFGVDGSRLAVPRTQSNEARFSPASSRRKRSRTTKRKGGKKSASRSRSAAARANYAKAKKADSPQLWLTTMWHAGTGLPWDWRLGPSDSSERAHMREMLDQLPANALVVADAGFVGYDYWKAIVDGGRYFVIRVGGNVKLLKRLGVARESEQTVYLWPDKNAKKNQPPLTLRLIVVQEGRQAWYLVTSVLAKSQLSDADVANVLQAYRTILREYKSYPDPGESLTELVTAAVTDDYPRTNKRSRNHPRKKAHEPTQKPVIVKATKSQVQKAQQLHAV